MAYRVVQEALRLVAWAAWVACRVEQGGLRRAAWVAWVVGQEAWVVSHRSSLIPQHRSGATSSWTHGEHITILQR